MTVHAGLKMLWAAAHTRTCSRIFVELTAVVLVWCGSCRSGNIEVVSTLLSAGGITTVEVRHPSPPFTTYCVVAHKITTIDVCVCVRVRVRACVCVCRSSAATHVCTSTPSLERTRYTQTLQLTGVHLAFSLQNKNKLTPLGLVRCHPPAHVYSHDLPADAPPFILLLFSIRALVHTTGGEDGQESNCDAS
jgi:hypothetical protein